MFVWSEFQPNSLLTLQVVAGPAGLRAIHFGSQPQVQSQRDDSDALIREALGQLRAYFGGNLRQFDLPLDICGTEFQKRVWHALQQIPYGETCSYRSIAQAIAAPKAVRAVGAANGRNPLPIVIPCHRVVGANGDLVGFSSGLAIKRMLLDLESGHAHHASRTAAAR